MTSVQQRVSQFKRLFDNPLDIDSVFQTVSEMNDYLIPPSNAYAGMVVTCLEEEGKIFILNNDLDAWLDITGEVYSKNYQSGLPDVNDVNVGDSYTCPITFREFRLIEIDSVRGWVETTPPQLEIEEIAGPTGPQGIQGETGPQGVTGTIEWSSELIKEFTTAELYIIISEGTLIPKQWYLITDFQHKTIVAGTEGDAEPVITTGAVEEIYVQADSTTTFNSRAFSKTYEGEELVFKTFGNTLYVTDTFGYSLGDETYLSITDTDELTFVDDMFPTGYTSTNIYILNYDTGTYVNFTKDDYGTKWTYDSNTKTLTNLFGMLAWYYTEYYDGEPSSLNITSTGQYTFTCTTDEIDTFTEGYIYFYDNDSGDGGEVYAEDRGVSWEYDDTTHTFTLLNADEWGGGNFSFLNDWYGEFNFACAIASDWADDADMYVEGEVTSIFQEFDGKIVERKVAIQDFRFAGDYRSQLARRYKILCDDWAAGTYSAGSVVRYSSTIWVATVETTDTPSTTTAINWIGVCADNYVLAATTSFSGLFNFTLTIDPATYYDYPVLDLTKLSDCRNSIVRNNSTADEINVVFLNQIVNSTVETTSSTFTTSIANSNIIASSGYFSALTNTVGSFNTVFSNGISYSNIGYMQACLLNNSITRNTIVSMSGVYSKNAMNDNTISYMSSVVLYSYIKNSLVLKLTSTMFLNYIDELYIANLYNCTFSDYTYRTQFFAKVYYTNFLGKVLNCSCFGMMYGTSDTVRQTIGYFSGNTILGSMTLNYFSAGFNFDGNFLANAFSNNFTAAVPANGSSRFRNNVCMGVVTQLSGAGQFYFESNVCLNKVFGLTLSNSTYGANIQGNTFIGEMGSSGTGWIFNNTTEIAQVKYNLFKKSAFSWTVTRGIVEYNEFGSSFTNVRFGNTATYTFSYNVIGDGYSNNAINASMSYNTLPSGWSGKTITTANAFNYLFLTNAIGGTVRNVSASGNAAETDYHITVDATGGSRTITLLASVANGRTLRITKTDSSANTVVVAAAGSDTINGAASITLRQQYETISLQDTATGVWRIFSQDRNIVQGSFTATRVPFVDANGRLTDDADLTFDTDTLSATKLKSSSLTPSEIVLTDANKQLVSAAVATYPSLTELSYVKGVSSAIQTQLGDKAPTASPTFTTKIETPTIELGHASDTTISRVSAGVIAVEGVAIPTISSTNTLTNKRITKRVLSAANYTTDTGTSLNCDTLDMFIVTAQAGALKLNNPTGTPTDGQTLWVAITGTADRALTYDTQFEASLVELPTTTIGTARIDLVFVWRADISKWRCIGVM